MENSSAAMTPSKIEIKMRKAEPGSWSKLDIPRVEEKKQVEPPKVEEEPQVDSVDLSDVEAVQNIYRVNISELEKVE